MQLARFASSLLALSAACASPNDTGRGFYAAEALFVAGCPEAGPPTPVDRGACLFGDVFADLRTSTAVQIVDERWIRSVEGIAELEGDQLLRAVQQSSHTDVSTPLEALERVDQAEVRRIDFYELASGHPFVAFEYGAGDNSYGAYFPRDSAEVVASIHDGDVLDCTVFVAAEGG